MLEFFGTILILYLIWVLVKPLLLRYAQRKYTEKVNDMFNQAFGPQAGFRTGGAPPFGREPRQPRHQQRRKKIFSREDGEYVEFEEIDVKVDYRAQETAEKHGPAYTPREPQVSDAEWEEIR